MVIDFTLPDLDFSADRHVVNGPSQPCLQQQTPPTSDIGSPDTGTGGRLLSLLLDSNWLTCGDRKHYWFSNCWTHCKATVPVQFSCSWYLNEVTGLGSIWPRSWGSCAVRYSQRRAFFQRSTSKSYPTRSQTCAAASSASTIMVTLESTRWLFQSWKKCFTPRHCNRSWYHLPN